MKTGSPTRCQNGCYATRNSSIIVGAFLVLLLPTEPTWATDASGQPGSANALSAVDVGDEIHSLVEADWTERDRLFAFRADRGNGIVRINARGVTTNQDAAGAVDGIKDGTFGFHVAVGETDPWWQVDLVKAHRLDRVVIYNRIDGGHAARTRNIKLSVASDNEPTDFRPVYQHDGTEFYGVKGGQPLVVDLSKQNVMARFVRIHAAGVCNLALDEVEVYAADNLDQNIALGKPANQKSVSRHSRPGTRGKVIYPIAEAQAEFSLAHSRNVVERGRRLATRLASETTRQVLTSLTKELSRIDSQLADLERADTTDREVRKAIHFQVRWLVRKIAFANPLLDIDKLLFIKRHRGSLPHMCDQYYGFTAQSGGGLFVLSKPFSDRPQLTNVLQNATVENGRLKGKTLEPGAFLSPELSFDGQTIYFAYSENREAVRSWEEVWPPEKSKRKWSTTDCYHIFKVNADGTELEHLTDGPWDDFDPCCLPGGRIVFVSERRGGFVRCGIRACRSFNLCSMQPDGSDIFPISYFDTNEWHPSVGNDGMLVYTRWDYIDRNTTIAHHLWTCYPDGRDPRAPHGNYPALRSDRPFAELSIRAIPNSHKYVATAAPHHGFAFGSLVLIDLRDLDDNSNSQITRLTPEVPFPEAEGPVRANEVYGTPWPLSEQDFLCAYDRKTDNHGIYWIDCDGNKELIYRDPSISCVSPMPLEARTIPPIIPDNTTQSAPQPNQTADIGTVALMDVYDSDFEWPAGTEITHLRILQILPKSTPSRNSPRIGIAEQTNARAVLGTVPVEPDGSAYFEAPPSKLIYFQALDATGMAVQSMRTATYVHPGEQLTCQGCHEPKHRPPSHPNQLPLALQRPPSRIIADVEGSDPFNYVRLVQPVLDRHCVQCHQKKNAIDLTGAIQVRPCPRDKHKSVSYTTSYNNLAEKYGFYFHAHSNWDFGSATVVDPSRTTAGQFGARAAKLSDYLGEQHYGVELSDKDLHRINLWLDCNSDFYGAYERPEAQARGEVVKPSLD